MARCNITAAIRKAVGGQLARRCPSRSRSPTPGAGLKRQLNGGIEVAYGARMRPGDVITSVTRLAGYSERKGRLGLMLFAVSEDSWTNQSGELIKRTRNT